MDDMSQFNPVYFRPPDIFKIYFNIIRIPNKLRNLKNITLLGLLIDMSIYLIVCYITTLDQLLRCCFMSDDALNLLRRSHLIKKKLVYE
jgi:hypothetical protein